MRPPATHALSLLLLAFVLPRSASAAPDWETRGTLPVTPPGLYLWTVAETGGRIFAFATDPAGAGNYTYEFVPGPTPADDAWIAKTPKPGPVTSYIGAAVVDGLVHVPGGGLPGSASTAEAYVYDPAGDAWSALPPVPREVNGYAIAAIDGRVHIAGGCCDPRRDDLHSYDPAAGWTTSSSLLSEARNHPAGAASDGKLFVFGGHLWSASTRVATVDVYDPATDSWETWPPLPSARSGASAVACSDGIYVIGGSDETVLLDRVDVLDAATRTWSGAPTVPQLAVAKSFGGAVLWRGDIWTFPFSAGVPVQVLRLAPPDQGNVLRAVRRGVDVVLDFASAAADAWRITRDVDKLSLGRTALMPDVSGTTFVDPGASGRSGDDYYRVKGVSPCGAWPSP